MPDFGAVKVIVNYGSGIYRRGRLGDKKSSKRE